MTQLTGKDFRTRAGDHLKKTRISSDGSGYWDKRSQPSLIDLRVAIFTAAQIKDGESGRFQNIGNLSAFARNYQDAKAALSLTQRAEEKPAMSRAPSLLDSVPPASSPTKPTFSFFWSACAPGNTPPLRDFCTMTEPSGDLPTYSHGDQATTAAPVDGSVPAAGWRRGGVRVEEGGSGGGGAQQADWLISCSIRRKKKPTFI